jgi:hypothetical protein
MPVRHGLLLVETGLEVPVRAQLRQMLVPAGYLGVQLCDLVLYPAETLQED